MNIKQRFRGFLPVVVDIETAGFDSDKDAVLEVAMVTLTIVDNQLKPDTTFAKNIIPFEGATLNPDALKFNGVLDPFNPLRDAIDEQSALDFFLPIIKQQVKKAQCTRAVLVGHNAWFDLHFLNAMIDRCGVKSPFHAFSSFDTATLGVLAYRHTVLAEVSKRANLQWSNESAHSAIYDAEKTAELFCKIINQYDEIIKLNT